MATVSKNFKVKNGLEVGASTTSRASLNIPHGTAPSSPINGDFWTTTAGAYVRINGTTVGPLASSAGAGTTWGAITGTLSSQTDLQTALDAKLNLSGGTLTGSLTLPGTAGTRNLFMSSGHAVLGLVTIGRSGSGYGTIGDGYRTTSSANSYNYDRNDYATMLSFSSGAFSFQTSALGTAGNPVTFAERFFINNAGDISNARDATIGRNLTVTGTTTLSGDLTIGKASPVFTVSASSGNAYHVISAAASATAGTIFRSAGSTRWVVGKNETPDSSTATGSDFVVRAYDNNAALLSTPLTITRSTGATTLTGDLTISKATATLNITSTSSDAYARISRLSGNGGFYEVHTNGVRRWLFGADTAAESGSNAGSNFALYSYSDAGSFISTVLHITRSTGLMTLTGDLTIGKASPSLLLNATSGSPSVNISGVAGTFRGLQFKTAGTRRWTMYANADAESGSDVGSDFAMYRANDAGSETRVMYIQRSTGNVTFDNAVTLTGDLTVSKATPVLSLTGSGSGYLHVNSTDNHSTLYLDSPAALGSARIRLRTGANTRWELRKNYTAESGSNAGSNFELMAYDDAGTPLSTPLTITRSTGAFSITGDVSIAKSNAMMTVNSSSTATPAYFRVYRDAGQFGGMSINTGSTSRWLVAGNNTAEAGSDAGSDFIIRRYSDAGGSLGDALTITRSTGNATFSGTVTAPTFTPSTSINLAAVADTATAATHYYVETATDGLIRPKTLADVKTEVVTNAAVNSAAATTVGTVTSGTWQGTAINATYIDSAIARLASPTFTGTVTTPGVKRNVVTKSALYTLTASDHIVIATSGTWTATLPTAASIAGTEYIIKNSGSGIITVDPAGTETIDGSTTIDLAQYDSLTVVSDGTNWVIV